MTMLAILAAATVASAPLAAQDTLVSELERRLAAGGVVAVNAALESNSAATLRQLNAQTAACELQAVSLSIRLARGGSAKVVAAHKDALRLAIGDCTRFVLALLAPGEVPKFCASVESWTVMQTARELRRRISAIEADTVLRSSQRGQACRAAYLYELRNTRVGLTTRPPTTSGPSK